MPFHQSPKRKQCLRAREELRQKSTEKTALAKNNWFKKDADFDALIKEKFEKAITLTAVHVVNATERPSHQRPVHRGQS